MTVSVKVALVVAALSSLGLDCRAAEMKCTTEISVFKTESVSSILPERRGSISLLIVELPSRLVVQPVTPSGAPYELGCSAEADIVKCRTRGILVALSFSPGKPTNVVIERQTVDPRGLLTDMMTCRFLKPGETALD